MCSEVHLPSWMSLKSFHFLSDIILTILEVSLHVNFSKPGYHKGSTVYAIDESVGNQGDGFSICGHGHKSSACFGTTASLCWRFTIF